MSMLTLKDFRTVPETVISDILVGVQSSSTMARLNLNFKILGEIPGGSIIFHHVQAKSEL